MIAARPAAALAALTLAAALAPAAQADFLDTIEHPTRVPAFSFISLGNGIEPGASGVYGFNLTNRYNSSIDNVSLTVEIYRYATVEVEQAMAAVASPPTFAAGGAFLARMAFPTVPANGSVTVRLQVDAPRQAPEGVYFTRHLLEFDYSNVTEPPAVTPQTGHFVMKSRGYFNASEFASINYSDLHNSLAALNISGVIPDSSFSVKPPAPIWPLATLVVFTAVSGTMAFVYYLVDQHPGRHRKLERAVLRLEGKLRIWRALLRSAVFARIGRGRTGSKPPKAE
jgi:hypothetical protein